MGFLRMILLVVLATVADELVLHATSLRSVEAKERILDWNCNDFFELDEPPYDGFEYCDECRAEEESFNG